MTVKELIEKLKKCPEDASVFVPTAFTDYEDYNPVCTIFEQETENMFSKAGIYLNRISR